MPGFRLSNVLRPKSLDDFVGMESLVGKQSLFRKGLEKGRLYSSILYGPPGCGKTSFAFAACTVLGQPFGYVDCTQTDSDSIRLAIRQYNTVILDEIQYLNKKQQQLLLQATEQGGLSMLGLTTEYPAGRIFEGLLDRCSVYHIFPLTKEQMEQLTVSICNKYSVKYDLEAVKALCYSCQSMRGVYNKMEQLVSADLGVTVEAVKLFDDVSLDADKVPCLISALQKSIRGSDPDASVYYLGQLLKIGELEYTARRLRVIASEDVGLADRMACLVVDSCITAALQCGMPEARIPLSHAVLCLALAPKSNSVVIAIDSAMGAPSAKTPRCIASENAVGYIYPHDYPGNYYPFDYLPDSLKGSKFYTPGKNKWEISAMEYLSGKKMLHQYKDAEK